MENLNKIDMILERINEYNFKISDVYAKISEAEKEGSEYASKIDGYNELLEDYIAIKNSLQQAIDNIQ